MEPKELLKAATTVIATWKIHPKLVVKCKFRLQDQPRLVAADWFIDAGPVTGQTGQDSLKTALALVSGRAPDTVEEVNPK